MMCPVCGSNAPPVNVHGHEQCSRCGRLSEGCCEGAGDVCNDSIKSTKDSATKTD